MKSILVADDKPDIRDILAQFLRDQSYDVDTAENGKAAFKKLKNRYYDVLVTDLLMPVQDGFTLIENLKNDAFEVYNNLAIIIITGGSPSLDFQQSLQSMTDKGCVVLKKPFTKDELIQACDDVLNARPFS